MTAVSEIIMGKNEILPPYEKTQIGQKNTQKPRQDLKKTQI